MVIWKPTCQILKAIYCSCIKSSRENHESMSLLSELKMLHNNLSKYLVACPQTYPQSMSPASSAALAHSWKPPKNECGFGTEITILASAGFVYLSHQNALQGERAE
jgi:hypothetical protein